MAKTFFYEKKKSKFYRSRRLFQNKICNKYYTETESSNNIRKHRTRQIAREAKRLRDTTGRRPDVTRTRYILYVWESWLLYSHAAPLVPPQLWNRLRASKQVVGKKDETTLTRIGIRTAAAEAHSRRRAQCSRPWGITPHAYGISSKTM